MATDTVEMKVVQVEWVDSVRVFMEWTENPQDAISDLDNYNVIVHSVGYLAKEWEDKILLVQNDGHDQICMAIIIPKISIRNTTRLEVIDGIHDRNFNSER